MLCAKTPRRGDPLGRSLRRWDFCAQHLLSPSGDCKADAQPRSEERARSVALAGPECHVARSHRSAGSHSTGRGGRVLLRRLFLLGDQGQIQPTQQHSPGARGMVDCSATPSEARALPKRYGPRCAARGRPSEAARRLSARCLGARGRVSVFCDQVRAAGKLGERQRGHGCRSAEILAANSWAQMTDSTC